MLSRGLSRCRHQGLQVAMPVDLPHLDLPECNQPVQQRQRRILCAEAALRLRAASELAVQVLQRVGRARRLPHRPGELVERQQLRARFLERPGHRRAERRPLPDELLVGPLAVRPSFA